MDRLNSTMNLTKELVIDYIASLGEAEAVDLCFEALKSRRIYKEFEGNDFQIDDVYAIANCSFGSFEGKIDDSALVDLYAQPLSEFADLDEKSVLSERGFCEKCKVTVLSYAKVAHCPICGDECELT